MKKDDFMKALVQGGTSEDDLQEQFPAAFLDKYGSALMAFDSTLERIIEAGESSHLELFLRTCALLIQSAPTRHVRAVEAAKGKAAMAFWSSQWGKA